MNTNLFDFQLQMTRNHGKFVGVASWIKNHAKNKSDVDLAVKMLLEVLEEHQQIEEKAKCKLQTC